MKINMILLAAGNSRRFGSNKLLHKMGEQTLFELALSKALLVKASGLVQNVVVVTQYEEIVALGRKLEQQEAGTNIQGSVIYIKNEAPEKGISHSIALGIDESNRSKSNHVNADVIYPASEEQTEAYLFMVCDQPWLKTETIENLLKEFNKSDKKIGCVCFGKRSGNPVIFDASLENELKALEGDKGGKVIIKRYPEQVYHYQITNEIELEDMDYQV